MITPCIILTEERAADLDFIFSDEILPGIRIAPYLTERKAKRDAKRLGGTFARIDYEKVFFT
ncbi:MAG: hypothetical protein ABR999_10665 [Methanoregula sp.]|jgi:hypothetical protein|uniref:hypothetical protein n=1 Tax=Methanoregula sp. TaxID=2052170 RepID=UPI003D0C0F33